MQSVFDILEWPQVLSHLESFCQTGYGRTRISETGMFLETPEAITAEILKVQESKDLLLRYGEITMQEPADIVPTLQRLAKSGEFHSIAEAWDVLHALRQLRQLMRFFIQHRSHEETPLLMDDLAEVTLPNSVIELLEARLDDRGELRETASMAYGELLQKIRDTQAQIKNILQGMMGRSTFSRYLQEPIVTERDGRSVLPVKAEHKVDVPGIVHGTSATGVTLYIEPKAVVEFNNRLVSAKNELTREIRRILRELSESLIPEVPELETFVEQAGKFDLLLAKARQSRAWKANPVQVLETPGTVHLRQARHPLLIGKVDPVVANDVFLAPPTRTLLITGPNTGGKTVLLKLLGLAALMLRSGLHLPVAEGSSLSVFDPIMADIGDPQSITQSLSTFSGHIARLKSFLEQPDLSDALILIDEICAGTDPQEGSALAEAMLETFYHRGATTVVTTHIGELKVLAHQHEGYLNACVEFDAESLSPTYRLILGVPGTSNALNIAQRLGMPEEVVNLARTRLVRPASESATLIESLELKNRQIAEDSARAAQLKQEIEWEETQLREQLNRLEGEKKKILQMFREGLKHKLRYIEQEVDDLKHELNAEFVRDEQALRDFSGRFKKLQNLTGEVFIDETEKLYPSPQIPWESLKIGDTVESRSLSMTGEIIAMNADKQEVTLRAGMLKTTIALSDIIRSSGAQKSPKKAKDKQKHRDTGYKKGTIPEASLSSWSIDCDVRGLTQEDAIGILEKYLDDALLSGAHTLNVIHGLGTGVLKKAIRGYLKELPFVKKFGPAPASEGGDGKTIVEL